VTLSNDEVEKMQSLSDDEFAQTVERRLKGKLGNMHLASKRHVYPLVGVHAKQFIANRFAVIGDAAVGMHPVTAHGFNLGLGSQKILAKEIVLAQSKQQDIGCTKVLERYQRQHMIATRVIYHGTNLVVGLFTNDNIGAKIARKLTMRFANNFAPIKNVISAKLTEKLTNKSSLPFL
jgi:2-polyprenyl-6-methoxyphenol hydroxylase-like FAD-dependent oxidoreductase